MSKDLFSKQSDIYVKYRPDYPPELIEHILQYVTGRTKAWDCASGNGQAAVLLANHFDAVEATDISEKQISNSIQHPRIRYSVSAAEKTDFPDHDFDLIAVAQAYHWFNFESFEREVKRVLRPDGVIAVWGYSLVNCEDRNLNHIINSFYTKTVGPFWDPERKFVDDHYQTVPFPYSELPSLEFFIEKEWDIENFAGYLNTWSSVQHFIKARGFNPVDALRPELEKTWPATDMIRFRFPVFIRIGKV